jgi:hypothetical protein
VGFLVGDDEPPVAFLGNVGFLEHFTAVFDYVERRIRLEPKAVELQSS